ncbi:MAG: hypothetical protein M0R77_16495 [Gammaproteobacteria bacterium]|nr:hypothetical protein [Gammaproteobacteria bacterium]
MSTETPEITYECLDPLGGPQVRVRFSGRLLGQAVLWDATLSTLAASGRVRRFIEVGGSSPHGTLLAVGLDVPCIDGPTVLKTVIMIRGWKNLRPGRHEYGQPIGTGA